MMNGAEYAEYTREAYRNSTGSNKYLSDVPDKELDMLLPMFKQDAYVLESVMMAYDENGNYDPSNVRSFDWFDPDRYHNRSSGECKSWWNKDKLHGLSYLQ